MSLNSSDCVVLVTGGSGFIASHIVYRLLETAKCKVRTTVRTKSPSQSRVSHLSEWKEKFGEERLEVLYGADVLDEEAMRRAVEGATYVIHTVSVVLFNATDKYNSIVKPGVDGALNIGRACISSGSVRRVVLTSSVAAIVHKPVEGKVFSEEDWNVESTVENSVYNYTKSEQERRLRELMKDSAVELVTIHPSLVFGPLLTHDSTIPESVHLVADLLSWSVPMCPQICNGVCDVRDVAEAHVRAVERGEDGDRILVNEGSHDVLQISKKLMEIHPSIRTPLWVPPNALAIFLTGLDGRFQRETVRDWIGKSLQFDNSKSKEVLGLEYRTFERTLEDTASSLLDRRLVSPVSKHGFLSLQLALLGVGVVVSSWVLRGLGLV